MALRTKPLFIGVILAEIPVQGETVGSGMKGEVKGFMLGTTKQRWLLLLTPNALYKGHRGTNTPSAR